MSRAFVRAGAQVLATGVAQGELNALADDPDLANADLRRLDVREPDSVAALATELPSLDALVKCAGIIARGAELDPTVFAGVVDVNLNGAMRVCAATRPLLARAGGAAIVNLASMLAIFGGGLVPGYSAGNAG